MAKVRAFVEAKEQRRNKILDERFERAIRDFQSIVARIISEVDPERIYQWGSLLDRNRFSEISDIDVALEGLRGPEAYFKALGIAIECTGLPVDVVEIEKVPPDVADRIRTRGRIVYERTDA